MLTELYLFFHWDRFTPLQLSLRLLAFVVWAVLLLCFTLGATFIVRRTYYGPKEDQSEDLLDAPGVSILRPLKGLDFRLRENLESTFRQSYSKFEVILCVAEKDDPAIPVARQVMAVFPKIPSRLLIGEHHVGVNPKINNLHQAYHTAQHPILWVLDSNIYQPPHALTRAIRLLHSSPNVGLVHHAPTSVQPADFSSLLEHLFLTTVHTRMYTTINWTGLASCVNGKSNLYRKEDIDRIGGFEKYGIYLAEDNLIGEAIMRLGKTHRLAPDLAWQPMGKTSGGYFGRRTRWTRIRKVNVTAATVAEPWTECFTCMAYGIWAAQELFELTWIMTMMLIVGHTLWWMVCDLAVVRHVRRVAMESGVQEEGVGWGKWVVAWWVRELTAVPLWLVAVAGTKVEWRGREYRLKTDGSAVLLR